MTDPDHVDLDQQTLRRLRDTAPDLAMPRMTRAEFAAKMLGELTDPHDVASVDEWGHAG